MKTTLFLLLLILISTAGHAAADTFGSGANTFEIEFVTIGNPNNVADNTGNPFPPYPTGSVPYIYRIGKFEISRDMIDKASAEGSLGITLGDMSPWGGNGPNKPATFVTWFEIARFVNWLNTSTGNTPAYKFDGNSFALWTPSDAGYDPANLYRNSRAKYFLPSVDEWYKAAYFNPATGIYYNYPTGSDTAPAPVAGGTAVNTAVYNVQPGPADIMSAGGLSPYRTMAQGGNVWEWEETDVDLVNDSNSPSVRANRGSNWIDDATQLLSSGRAGGTPSSEGASIGFRVASNIPEPSTLVLVALASVGLCLRRRARLDRETNNADCR